MRIINQIALKILGVHLASERHLFEVVQATDSLRLRFCPGQRRKQHQANGERKLQVHIRAALFRPWLCASVARNSRITRDGVEGSCFSNRMTPSHFTLAMKPSVRRP